MFSYPHPAFWIIHVLGIAFVYALGKSSAQEKGQIFKV